MARAMCPACLTQCYVRDKQFDRRVICPACQSKFVPPAPTPLRLDPVGFAMGIVALAGGAITCAMAFK